MGTSVKKLKANTLGLQELPRFLDFAKSAFFIISTDRFLPRTNDRLEDLFVNGFEAARDSGVPEDVSALKLLRSDLVRFPFPLSPNFCCCSCMCLCRNRCIEKQTSEQNC